jgi:RNase H-like domain found in reverse transcriptase
VQLLPDAHQGLRSDRRSTVQAYPEGLQIQSGASARGSKRCLHQQLVSEPVMAFPWTDWLYALITDAATCTANTPGGLGAILTQVDQEGKFCAISFASSQLKDHEKNYSQFLLEAAAAVWGMDNFNEYLKGKKFILYTDQMVLLEHDFIIQYKKGSDMTAVYLWLPATVNNLVIAAFNPFQTGLAKLKREEGFAKNIHHFGQTKKWPAHLSKKEVNAHMELLQKMFHDMGEAHLQKWISQNGTVATKEVSEEGCLRSPQQHFRCTWRDSQNVHQDYVLLLLAWHLYRN